MPTFLKKLVGKNWRGNGERDSKEELAHGEVLSKKQAAAEGDAEAHETGMEAAEHRREEIAKNNQERIKAHNAIDERMDQALGCHEQIVSERQEAEEEDLRSHEHGLKEAEQRREEIANNNQDRIKAHNAIEERTDQVLDRHEQILSERQEAEEEDLRSHEHGLKEAEQRREEIARNNQDRIKAHNAIDERTDQVLGRHEQILSERQTAEEEDLRSHEHGLKYAEHRREEIAKSNQDLIKAHNAIDERTDQVLERHEEILSERQRAEEEDLRSHEHGLKDAERRREEIAKNNQDRIKAHNAIDERTDQVLGRHEQIISERRKAGKEDLNIHQRGLEAAEQRHKEIAQKELDRIKAHNAIAERTDQVLDRHGQILSDRQKAEEEDWNVHQHGLEAAEQRRKEIAQEELDRIIAHNAIEERTDQVLDRHGQILSDRRKAEEEDLNNHEHGLMSAEQRRKKIAQEELDRIKAHNAIDDRTEQVLDRHAKILSDRYKSEEMDLKNHEHGLEAAERLRKEIARKELDRIKEHNAIEERTNKALDRHAHILDEQQKDKEADWKSHEHGLKAAEHLRNEIAQKNLDRTKAHNDLEEKMKRVLEERARVLTEQEKRAKRDAHKHEKALHRAEHRRASIRDEQLREIKAYNNIEEWEKLAAEKRNELAAVSSQSLEKDLATTDSRLERAEKVKNEMVKEKARIAKETLQKLDEVRKRHDDIERDREQSAIEHFDAVNRAIMRRDSALGDAMDAPKTQHYSRRNSSNMLTE